MPAGPIVSQRVHHVSFSIDALPPALHFYRDVLGFEPLPRPDFGVEGAWLAAGDTQVHLIVAPDGADVGSRPDKTNPLANHTAFLVEDYQATVDHLKGHGLDVLETNADRGQLWVSDPSGNVLEFTTGR